MATLNEIAYNILNIARSGRSSDDDTLSLNQIKHWIHYYRGSLLQKYTSNGRKIHPNCLQVLIAPVVDDECGNGRIDQVPDVMSFSGQRAIERIEVCDGNGWAFPSEIIKNSAEEIIIYVFYDTTSLGLEAIKDTYNGIVDWINTQKYNIDNPQLGLEGHKVKIAYHTACTSERWLDWGTVPLTGIFNNACDSGGAGTGHCGGLDLSVSLGSGTSYITQGGIESGSLGGYGNIAASGTTADCSKQATHTGGGVADAIDVNRNGYSQVFRVQDWVQNGPDVSLNNPANTIATGYSGNLVYNEPPKKATYYDGTDSFEQSTGNNERVISGSSSASGFAIVSELINGTWVQVGSTITGAVDDYTGRSVDISKDGDIIVVASPQISKATDRGYVKVYKYFAANINDWIQLGTTIVGQAGADRFGDSVSISKDGYRVAISAPGHDGNIGTVQIYEYDLYTSSPDWVQMGSDVDGDVTNNYSGGQGYNNTISLAGYDPTNTKWGTTLVIGHPGTTNGTVRIFVWNGSSWNQSGPSLQGQASGDQFGFSLALNTKATRMIVGAPYNNGGGNARGEAYVYENQSGVWTQVGSDLAGEATNDAFGSSVDIDEDGNHVIVGARGNAGGGTNRGHARVYLWNNSSVDWVQRGLDIDGEDDNDNAFAVSITDDGYLVALGSPENDDNGTNSGYTKIYKYWCGEFRLIGSEINGSTGQALGHNVSLSNKSSKDTVVFYDTEPGTYAVNYGTHTSPALVDSPNSNDWTLNSTSSTNRRLGISTIQGFGPPPIASSDDNVLVLIFADEASDADTSGASEHGGPYHTNFLPGGNTNFVTNTNVYRPPNLPTDTGQPVIMDATLNGYFNSVKAGNVTIGAVSYISTSLNVWRFATDNNNAAVTGTNARDLTSYTSQNTALTGYFNNVTIQDVQPSQCWKADWMHHVEKLALHDGLYRAYLYPTRKNNPGNQLQYNVPFALHTAGAISSGNQPIPDGTFTNDGSVGTVPYSQVTDLSALYYVNPYYTSGYGALDQFGWSLNYEMGVFNTQKLQSDLDDLLNTFSWTETVLPDNSTVELCDCYEHIPTNIDRLRFQQFNRFTPGFAINGERLYRWYIEPQGFRYHNRVSIVLPDWDQNLDLAKIWAVFSNPEDIPGYEADFEYPFPDELISPLIVEVLGKELNMTLTTSSDMLNDGSGVAPKMTSKPKQSDK